MIERRIANGPQPHRDHIPFGPSAFDELGELARQTISQVVDAFDDPIGRSTYSVEAAAPTGAPLPWQAADPVAPHTLVNLANGNLYVSVPVVSWDMIAFGLFYNSRRDIGVDTLSSGWSHSYTANLDLAGLNQNTLVYTADDGSAVTFSGDFDSGVDDRIYRLHLQHEPGAWTLADDALNELVFDESGALQSVSDASGNVTNMIYANGRLSEITDIADRSLVLTYTATGQLNTVTAPSLLGKEDPIGSEPEEIKRVFACGYNNDGRLDQIYSMRRAPAWGGQPLGDLLFSITLGYEETGGGRLNAITDYEGNESLIHYDPNTDRVIQVDHPPVYDFAEAANVVTSRHYNYVNRPSEDITSVTDERGGITTYVFDSSGRLVRIDDPLGRVLRKTTWTALNRPAMIANVLGGRTTFAYNDAGDVISTTTPRGIVYTEFDDLHRLIQVTDPVRNVITYAYENDDNPTRITRMTGPGEANESQYYWGCKSTEHRGKLEQMTPPNLTSQGFQYDGPNFSRYLDQNFPDRRECAENSQVTDDPPCPPIHTSGLTSDTGEIRVAGTEDPSCPPMSAPGPGPSPFIVDPPVRRDAAEDSDCASDEPLLAGPSCPLTGCETARNESGSRVYLDPNGGGTDGRELGTSAPNGLTMCGGPDEPFQYDGNERLTCAYYDRIDGSAGPMQYTLVYDARGRMEAMVSDTPTIGPDENDPSHPGPRSYDNVVIDADYEVRHEFADTIGAWRVAYTRETPPDQATSAVRTFTTTYRTDAGGRIRSVEREGRITKYVYNDSTILPAVVEHRPDGTKSATWLDADGMIRRVAHTGYGGLVLASFTYTRDAKGRVIRVEEEVRDERASDGYRSDIVEYTYGDGNLTAADLDNAPTDVPNSDKLYYSFLADLGPRGNAGVALKDADPNRLVTERRFNDDPDDAAAAVTFMNEYFYDHGGNRLAKRVSDPESGDVQSVTRYNYFTSTILSGEISSVTPGNPFLGDNPKMDYAGRGKNMLFSTQTYYPAEPDRIDVVEFEYDGGEDMAGKTEQSYRFVEDEQGAGRWELASEGVWQYTYKRGQLEKVRLNFDAFCTPGGDILCQKIKSVEHYVHDIFGRRIAKIEASDFTDSIPPPAAIMYDYDGLSHTLLAERHATKGAFVCDDNMIATYTQGPFGAITRTDERFDYDLSNNKDAYYLTDALGQNVAMVTSNAGVPSLAEPGMRSQVHDAFGVLIATIPAAGTWGGGGPDIDEGDCRYAGDSEATVAGEDGYVEAGPYRWRGWEASKTDRMPGLVEMQARTYDPSLGRFLQADALPIASLTTQGMNRYIYCENDPVNFSDPWGLAWNVIAGIVIIALGLTLSTIGLLQDNATLLAVGGTLVSLGFGLASMNVPAFVAALGQIWGFLGPLLLFFGLVALAELLGLSARSCLLEEPLRAPTVGGHSLL